MNILIVFDRLGGRLGHGSHSLGSFAKGLWVESSQFDQLQAAALRCSLQAGRGVVWSVRSLRTVVALSLLL